MADTERSGRGILPGQRRWRRILPWPTVRIVLTALYGALFATIGGLALAVIYMVSRQRFIMSLSDSELYVTRLAAQPTPDGTGVDLELTAPGRQGAVPGRGARSRAAHP